MTERAGGQTVVLQYAQPQATFGAECCAITATDSIRYELESWRGVSVLEATETEVQVGLGDGGPDPEELVGALIEVGCENVVVAGIGEGVGSVAQEAGRR